MGFLSDTPIFDKAYPNKAAVKTSKSAFDIQFDNAEKESKTRKGISFYCGKRHEFIFIAK